jgi:hypothetical protein
MKKKTIDLLFYTFSINKFYRFCLMMLGAFCILLPLKTTKALWVSFCFFCSMFNVPRGVSWELIFFINCNNKNKTNILKILQTSYTRFCFKFKVFVLAFYDYETIKVLKKKITHPFLFVFFQTLLNLIFAWTFSVKFV